uniref:NADH:ubiquinone reductase (H(+)-translocating) n=1 Tax=Plagiorchis maculosus TaxID=168655 RepID=A0A4D6C6I8_9TREM|nr:NADH dehydrogenase subunit 5 [Plagiorchis maculosus]QBX99314.1 NADH dehydrogenase subunit 5 [Plagiorchis maculosus]
MLVLFGLFMILGLFVFWCFDILGVEGSFFLLGYPWSSLTFDFLLDSVSLISLYMLICCGVVALFYCYHYFGVSLEGGSLFLLMCFFLSVMAFLVLSSSFLFSLVMWEYLGLVSFFLILFYSNMVSLRASLITLFASRWGDVSFFGLIMWYFFYWDFSLLVVCVLLFFVILTKSACYPFISWLIEAMRAPTPVSSLVHSSTLVAAGVWFLLRYSSYCSDVFFSYLLLFSLVTIFISGVCAVYFNDLKKIVALSTCNNVSWCIVFFLCGDVWLCLLQLLSHGVCKCYLFMSVGDVMSSSLGSQSSNFVYLSRYSTFLGVMLQFVLVFSLCGLPFIGVFFGKHGLLSDVFYCYGYGFISLFLVCFLVSYVYSFRLFLLLVGDCVGMQAGFISSFYSIALIVVLGTFLNYCGSFIFMEINSLGVLESFLLLFVQLFGCLLGFYIWAIPSFLTSCWPSSLFGGDFLVGSFYHYFLEVSSSFVFCLYRWEVFLLSFFSSGLSYFFSVSRLGILFFLLNLWYFLSCFC